MMLESSSGSSTLPPFSSLPPTIPLPQPVQVSRASRFRNSVTNRMSTTTAKLNSSSNGLHLRREIDNTSSNSGQQQNRISNVSPVAKVPNLHCLSKRNLIAHECSFRCSSLSNRITSLQRNGSPPSRSLPLLLLLPQLPLLPLTLCPTQLRISLPLASAQRTTFSEVEQRQVPWPAILFLRHLVVR